MSSNSICRYKLNARVTDIRTRSITLGHLYMYTTFTFGYGEFTDVMITQNAGEQVDLMKYVSIAERFKRAHHCN